MNILLVEDHKDIAEIIFDFFEIRENYLLEYTSDGKHGLQLALKNHYDVIILDIMLPGLSGLEVCRQLRSHGINIPILMLTARDNRQDILDGFEAGADDYLIKPFDLGILEARVQALHRRKTGSVALKKLSFSDMTLDLTQRTLTRADSRFELSHIHFTILKTMMMRAPEITTREELVKEIWEDEEPDGDILRSHIYQLRRLIDRPFEHACIKTVPKVGYQLIEAPEA